ncbi:KP4 killer toxin [Fusarium agapanthi]|uniref:KP4 killer toxin n=1 Tax=Fusarium agapanthi TaxID=1803897 RepID=A0A9P5B7X9_9HYPO|nr:KP4 killer toxin [Fusarium agapanthi]
MLERPILDYSLLIQVLDAQITYRSSLLLLVKGVLFQVLQFAFLDQLAAKEINLPSESSSPNSSQIHITAIFATALMVASNVAAGINCKGSVLCGQGTEPLSNLINYAGGLNDNRWYQNGQHIVCGGSLCAFLQNTDGLPGRDIKRLLGELRDHGCKYYSSVPVFFPNDNND